MTATPKPAVFRYPIVLMMIFSGVLAGCGGGSRQAAVAGGRMIGTTLQVEGLVDSSGAAARVPLL